MKRLLIILMLVLGWNGAQAGNYFGVRLDANIALPGVISSGAPVAYGIPTLGAQFGFDDSSGFGFRGSLSSLLLILNRATVDAYFRLPLGSDGSNAYAGVGGGAIFALAGVIAGVLEVHALVGYEFPIALGASVFFEGQPVVVFQPNISPTLALLVLSGGVNFRF